MHFNKQFTNFHWFNYLLALVMHCSLPVNSKILEKCDIAIQLKESNVSKELLDQWTCLAEDLSNLNTSAVKTLSSFQTNQSHNCQNFTLGLFQISNAWCNTPGDKEFGSCLKNGCNLDCFKLLDDDISDDINCIKVMHELHGFSMWSQITVNDCRRGIARNSDWNITECLNREKHRRNLTSIPLWSALLIVAVSSLTVFLLTYFFYRYRRNSTTILSSSDIKQFKYGRVSSMAPFTSPRVSQFCQDNFAHEPYNNEYEIPSSQFVIDFNQCLGAGAYGVVYKSLCKGKVVAAKTVKPNASKEYLQSLLGEIKILSHIGRHDCIVNMEGACTKSLNKGTVYVFMEFCSLGNLEKFLRSNRTSYLHLEDIQENIGDYGSGRNVEKSQNSLRKHDATLTLKHLLQYAHQVAKGMEFLASKQVIHGDLAARNILLIDKNVAKISDFGLSRKLYDYIHYIKKKEEPLPWRWMAIESLRENQFSTSSDVWMYGVLLFEVFSLGEVPYPGLSWSLDFIDKLEKGFRMLRPTHAPVNVYNNVMTKCWETSPHQRPSFSELSDYFHQALRLITAKDYTELFVEDKDVFKLETK